MSELCGDTAIMGAFDISDAYLQVDQPTPKTIRIIDRPDANYIIHRCLPGQRDGARRWYDHFSSFVQTDLGCEICAEVPSLFKLPDDKGFLLAHVDDVLFAIDEQYLNSVVKPILEARFRISLQTASRSGGSFEFLKRVHEFEPNYESLEISHESKHIKQAFQTFTRVNGKPPRLSKTPGAPHAFTYADESETLGDSQASVYRSLVGALLYLSHERPNIQFCAKSLSSSLKNPTVQAWHNLGRLIGYLKLHENVSLGMSKGGCGTSLFGLLHGHVEAQSDIMIESFSDANWGGNRDSRSTSSAQHFVNGQLVHSSSRNQHCIALSSTESEYYSLVSCAIDTLDLKHILELMFPSKNVVATVYVDNSACRQIANKLGTGRLRHIQGKLLWIQHMTKSGQIKIKAVGTTWNPADLGTKTLSADRHRMLCYMIPTTLDGGDLENVTYIFHMLKMQVLEILHFPHLKYVNYHM